MTTERDLDAIYQAKLDGQSDEAVMKKFSVRLRDIERAVIRNQGVNLNLYAERPKITRLAPKDFRLESTSVWSFKSRGKWATHSGNYRGNWSPYIPRNVILRYSEPGDLVLDQFCGGGTTAVEAKLLGRRCIALDINPAAVQLTRRSLGFSMGIQETLVETDTPKEFYEPEVEVGDALNLHSIDSQSLDLICTHPPYADIIHYTNGLEGDLSHHSVDEFIEDMSIVAKECHRVLKPAGVCSILIGDTRKNKRVIPMGFRTIDAFLEQGFILKDLIIKRQHNCRTTGFWYSSSIKHNFLLLAQEYLPIFVKSDSKQKQIRKRKSGKHTYSAEEAKIPAPPTKMECKTTWVLPDDELETIVDSNVLNRYGGNGRVLRIRPSADETMGDLEDAQFDLVYIDPLDPDSPSEIGIKHHEREFEKMLAEITPNITIGGHLVIRSRDFKKDTFTLSPTLSLWRIPLGRFKIREIIVATREKSSLPEDAKEIEISHEYLVVYQKDCN